MNVRKALSLLKKYETCHKCGNWLIGNGEGTVDISEDTFKRTCKCGWEIEIKDGDTDV